ncbi:MAG: hypothetical protein OEZ06_25380 [Myxococcales bacterium]|nr:hypothetical protein [Myxococcales bacterium]
MIHQSPTWQRLLAIALCTFMAFSSTACSSRDGAPAPSDGVSKTDGGGEPNDAGKQASGGMDSGMDATTPGDAGDSSTPTDADAEVMLPPPSECGRIGDGCAAAGDCCSNICDGATGACVSSLQRCAADGEACTSPTDCCNLSCGFDGNCGASACLSDGESCSENAECCGRSCTDGLCAPLNDSCKTAGNACGLDNDCCSGLCKDSVCILGASFCIQEGDICSRPEDCCTGRCDMIDGRDVGVCGPPPSGASFCSDGIEGSICDSCNDCCSRLCAPFGPTGVNVCQPASGCHVTGDFCREDRDCCGAADTGLPGEGNVTCEKEAGSDLGICRNPLSCSPQGNICHYMEYTCNVSAARANCCGGLGAMGGICQLDPLGVPRCNGLDVCREPGETCASADDCCMDLPCVPDASGVLRCIEPPPEGEPPCVPSTGGCTVNADCCPGNTCVRPVGSTQGTCNGTLDPPPPPPDGGTPDAGSCAEYGQICSQSSDCCNGVPCTDGICKVQL